MIKYTEQELKDKCLSWGIYYHNTCLLAYKQEDKGIEFDKWLAQRIKPAKKIIDLEPLIESGIDCEFWNQDLSILIPYRTINGLGQIGRSPINSPQYYTSLHCHPWDKCRPRMDHKMFYVGLIPIAGFVVRVYSDSVNFTVVNTSDNTIYWAGVTAIEYLGVEDGYAYPWEQAK